MDLQGQGRGAAVTGESGYAMVALLVSMSIMAVMLSVAMPTWKQEAQREKEAELVFRGQQYARAIGLFQRKYANAFPPSIDVLVEQRFLRKKYKDPITGSDFLPVTQLSSAAPGAGGGTANRPGATPTQGAGIGGASPPVAATPGGPASGGQVSGGLVGVSSKSKDRSIRVYNGRTHYNEWQFVYTPPTQQPGAPGAGGAPGTGAPGGARPGAPGSPQLPGGVPPGGPGGIGRPGGPGRPNTTGPQGQPRPFGAPPGTPPVRR